MAFFRAKAPLLGALASLLLLAAGCTTPSAPAEKSVVPAPVIAPATPPSAAATDPAPAPQPAIIAAPVAKPEPAPEPVPEPTPAPAPVVSPAPAPRPTPIATARPASIIGSEESSTMFDNFTAYISAIDGRTVPAGRAGWNTPLALSVGPHRLTVVFMRGTFTAQTDLYLQTRSEAAYQLKFATDAQIFGKSSYCEFSIVEIATGSEVLPPTRVPLTKLEVAK